MKKLTATLIVITAILLPSCTGGMRGKNTRQSVYICTGPRSARYHSTPECRGLIRCSDSITAVTPYEAETMGRTPCGICCE